MSEVIKFHLEPKEILIPLHAVTLAGLAWGNPKAPIILSIHGWLDNAASFSSLAPLLNDYYVVALDMPGHGKSSLLPESRAFPFMRMAKMLSDVIKYFERDQVILMAHSMGVSLASYFAGHFPKKINKLIFLDGFGVLSEELTALEKTPAAMMYKIFTALEKLPPKTYKTLEEMITLRTRVNRLSEVEIAPIVKRGTMKVEGGYQWSADKQLSLSLLVKFSEEKAQELLGKTSMPVLIIAGKDGILFEHEYFTARKNAVAQLTFHSLPAGHHLHISHADQVSQIINDFLKEK
jgi:pimeloyl-ACP methyl ester carboxylesterase